MKSRQFPLPGRTSPRESFGQLPIRCGANGIAEIFTNGSFQRRRVTPCARQFASLDRFRRPNNRRGRNKLLCGPRVEAGSRRLPRNRGRHFDLWRRDRFWDGRRSIQFQVRDILFDPRDGIDFTTGKRGGIVAGAEIVSPSIRRKVMHIDRVVQHDRFTRNAMLLIVAVIGRSFDRPRFTAFDEPGRQRGDGFVGVHRVCVQGAAGWGSRAQSSRSSSGRHVVRARSTHPRSLRRAEDSSLRDFARLAAFGSSWSLRLSMPVARLPPNRDFAAS